MGKRTQKQKPVVLNSDAVTKKQIEPLLDLIVNQNRQIARNQEFVSQFFSQDNKHQTAWQDYGYKEILHFQDFFEMYRRFGLAKALINNKITKCWQTKPMLVESEDDHEVTAWEQQVADQFDQLDFWRRLQGVDRRQRVGQYGGLVLIVADNKTFNDPLMKGQPMQLKKLVPAYQGQLEINNYVTDNKSADYGQPKKFNYSETIEGENERTREREVQIDSSRVIVWAEGSDSDNIYGEAAMESAFNSLVTAEKIIGAGGEGFWKNTRGSFHLDFDKDTNLTVLANALGTDVANIKDTLDEIIDEYSKGYDKNLMTQGATTTPLSISLPSPKEFLDVCVNDIAASDGQPATILIGQQTGRLASDEDNSSWAQENESRRENFVIPAIKKTVDYLIEMGFVPPPPSGKYFVKWESLLEPEPSKKLELGKIMSEINKNAMGTGQPAPFSSEQIALASGFEFDDGMPSLEDQESELDDESDITEE